MRIFPDILDWIVYYLLDPSTTAISSLVNPYNSYTSRSIAHSSSLVFARFPSWGVARSDGVDVFARVSWCTDCDLIFNIWSTSDSIWVTVDWLDGVIFGIGKSHNFAHFNWGKTLHHSWTFWGFMWTTPKLYICFTSVRDDPESELSLS